MATLMSLPTELRLQILNDVITAPTLKRLQTSNNPWYPLLLTSKILHNEATSLLRRATLCLRIPVATNLLAADQVERDNEDDEIPIEHMPQDPTFEETLDYLRKFSSAYITLRMGPQKLEPGWPLGDRTTASLKGRLEQIINPNPDFFRHPGRPRRISTTVSLVREEDPFCCYDPATILGIIGHDGILPEGYSHLPPHLSPWCTFLKAAEPCKKMSRDPAGRLWNAIFGFEHERRRLLREGNLMRGWCEHKGQWNEAQGWELSTRGPRVSQKRLKLEELMGLDS